MPANSEVTQTARMQSDASSATGRVTPIVTGRSRSCFVQSLSDQPRCPLPPWDPKFSEGFFYALCRFPSALTENRKPMRQRWTNRYGGKPRCKSPAFIVSKQFICLSKTVGFKNVGLFCRAIRVSAPSKLAIPVTIKNIAVLDSATDS